MALLSELSVWICMAVQCMCPSAYLEAARPCYWLDLQLATAKGPSLCKSHNLVILSKDLYLEKSPHMARQNSLASLPVAFRDSIVDKTRRSTLITIVKLAFNKGLRNQFELQQAALN